MKILNFIIELITSPFTLLIRSNVSNSSSKWCKPLIIVFISAAIVVLLILFFYRSFIFK